jgi:hypothetical protein
MYAGGLNTAAGKAAAADGQKRRQQRRIASGEIVSNKVLRARWEAIQGRPGYGAQEIAERAGFVSKKGQIDTTYLKRQLGVIKAPPSQKKGVKYPGSMMEYISYENAVRICRAMDMYPVEAGL